MREVALKAVKVDENVAVWTIICRTTVFCTKGAQPTLQKHVPLSILTQFASSGNNNLKWNYICGSLMCIFQYFNINLVSLIWCNETNSQLWLADGMFVFSMLGQFDFCKQQQQMMWWTEPAWYFQLRLRGLMSISVCWQASTQRREPHKTNLKLH